MGIGQQRLRRRWHIREAAVATAGGAVPLQRLLFRPRPPAPPLRLAGWSQPPTQSQQQRTTVRNHMYLFSDPRCPQPRRAKPIPESNVRCAACLGDSNTHWADPRQCAAGFCGACVAPCWARDVCHQRGVRDERPPRHPIPRAARVVGLKGALGPNRIAPRPRKGGPALGLSVRAGAHKGGQAAPPVFAGSPRTRPNTPNRGAPEVGGIRQLLERTGRPGGQGGR